MGFVLQLLDPLIEGSAPGAIIIGRPSCRLIGALKAELQAQDGRALPIEHGLQFGNRLITLIACRLPAIGIGARGVELQGGRLLALLRREAVMALPLPESGQSGEPQTDCHPSQPSAIHP